MGLFDFFRRRRPASPSDLPDPAKVSRIDYLLAVKHDQLEKPQAAFNNRNYLGLVEDQLAGSNVDMGLFNVAWQVKDAFELANLYWGQGNGERAEFYLRLTLERHARLCAAYASLARPCPSIASLPLPSVPPCCWARNWPACRKANPWSRATNPGSRMP